MSRDSHESSIQHKASSAAAVTASICLFMLLLYRFPLNGSLWLDETITKWITDASSLSQLFERVYSFQGQSPLYFSVIWLWRHLLGYSEFAIRLPSVLFTVLSAIAVWALASRVTGRGAAGFALLVFLASDPVAKFAVSARPYSLALLGAVTAALALVRYVEFSSLKRLTLFYSALLLTFYAHYLFLLIGVPLAVFVISARHQLDRRAWLELIAGGVAFCLVAAPGFAHLLRIFNLSGTYFYSDLPTAGSLLTAMFPPRLTLALIFSAVAALCFVPFRLNDLTAALKGRSVLMVAWWLTPPAIFSAYSHLSGGSLFLERFYGWNVVGLALLSGTLFGCISKLRAQNILILVFTSLLVFVPRQWVIEDWRGAIAAVNEELSGESPANPVLLYTGLIELEQIGWLKDSSKRSYLTAPLSAYPLAGDALLIPSNFSDADQRDYFEAFVEPLLEGERNFYLISPFIQQFSSADPKGRLPDYYVSFFRGIGFEASPLHKKGLVHSYKFERTAKTNGLDER